MPSLFHVYNKVTFIIFCIILFFIACKYYIVYENTPTRYVPILKGDPFVKSGLPIWHLETTYIHQLLSQQNILCYLPNQL